jgi:hypothetical protein
VRQRAMVSVDACYATEMARRANPNRSAQSDVRCVED